MEVRRRLPVSPESRQTQVDRAPMRSGLAAGAAGVGGIGSAGPRFRPRRTCDWAARSFARRTGDSAVFARLGLGHLLDLFLHRVDLPDTRLAGFAQFVDGYGNFFCRPLGAAALHGLDRHGREIGIVLYVPRDGPELSR